MPRIISISAVVLFCIPGCSDGDGAKDLVLEEASAQGILQGRARNTNDGSPVAGATVTVLDGSQTLDEGTTDGNGEFTFDLSTGRRTLVVNMTGFLDWIHDVPVTGQDLDLEVELVPLGETFTVDPVLGADIVVGDAVIKFPPGAYATQTTGTATYVNGTLNARAGTYMFLDEESQPKVTIGTLHVEMAEQPYPPVEVHFPVSSGSGVKLFEVDDRRDLVSPILPDRIENNMAIFKVEHFSANNGGEDPQGKKVLATQVAGTVEYKVGDGEWQQAAKDQPIPTGAAVRTGANGAAELTFPDGSLIRMKKNSKLRILLDEKGGFKVECSLLCRVFFISPLLKIYHSLRNYEEFSISPSKNTTCSVRGSIFSYESTPCDGKSGYRHNRLEIFEGSCTCELSDDELTAFPGEAVVGCTPFEDWDDGGNGEDCSTPTDWNGTWEGDYDLTLLDPDSGCPFEHAGTLTVTISGSPGAYQANYSMTGVEFLDASTCDVLETRTIDGSFATLVIDENDLTATINDGANISDVSATKNNNCLTGTIVHPDGSGSFFLKK